MSFSFYTLLIVAIVIGLIQASRQRTAPRLRLLAGGLAMLALLAFIVAHVSRSHSMVHRLQAANLRQGYVLGYGIGEFLAQTQPGRPLVILRPQRIVKRDRKAIKGLRKGLHGACKIVSQYKVDTSAETDFSSTASFFTADLLKDLRETGAEIVVSFCGLPVRVNQVDQMIEFDPQASLTLWRSPEYQALQWILTEPPSMVLENEFREGGVLAVAMEKLHDERSNNFPAHLDIEGRPMELFNKWFELITSDTGG